MSDRLNSFEDLTLWKRLGDITLSGIVGSRLAELAVASRLPGDPFYGFGIAEWFAWAINPLIVAEILFVYALCWYTTHKLRLGGVALWSMFTGGYLTLVQDFDVLPKLDSMPLPPVLDKPASSLPRSG